MDHGTVIEATKAVVTLDVALPGIIWGWMITLNMWAKSIGTGVVLVGAFLLYRQRGDAQSTMEHAGYLIYCIKYLFALYVGGSSSTLTNDQYLLASSLDQCHYCWGMDGITLYRLDYVDDGYWGA